MAMRRLLSTPLFYLFVSGYSDLVIGTRSASSGPLQCFLAPAFVPSWVTTISERHRVFCKSLNFQRRRRPLTAAAKRGMDDDEGMKTDLCWQEHEEKTLKEYAETDKNSGSKVF